MDLPHNAISCATSGCFAIISLHPDDERRMRKTEERFYCPAGHRNYFPKGPSKQDREIKGLERKLQHEQDNLRANLYAMNACPLGCGWSANRWWNNFHPGRWQQRAFMARVGNDLADHLRDFHGAKDRTLGQDDTDEVKGKDAGSIAGT